jgi:hypothetical protein
VKWLGTDGQFRPIISRKLVVERRITAPYLFHVEYREPRALVVEFEYSLYRWRHPLKWAGIPSHLLSSGVAIGVDWGGQSTLVFGQTTYEIRANPLLFFRGVGGVVSGKITSQSA